MPITLRAILLPLAGVLLLVNCGGGGDQATNPDPPDTTPASVEVTPGIDTVLVGNVVLLNARARNAAGEQVAATFSWSSSDPARATVSGTGLVTPLQTGIVWIRAATDTLADSTQVYLAPVITITHRLPSLFVGDTTRLPATFTRVGGGGLTVSDSTWSSSNPTIATVSAAGVVTGHAAGSAIIRLTSTGWTDSQTVVVLAGTPRTDRKLAFLRNIRRPADSAETPVVFVANADGSDEVQVSPVNSYVVEYSWSTSGNHLIIWHVNYNGIGTGGFSVVTPAGAAAPLLPVGARGARFAPDDARIAFHDGEGSDVVIKVANVDGSNVRTLSDPGAPNEVNPEWSPDGRQIAYRTEPCNILHVMDADGRNKRPLVTGARGCTYRWSPDGKEIGYTNGTGVWAVNVETGNIRTLSPNCSSATACGAPAHTSLSWRYDGSRVAMSNVEGTGSVTIINRDGSNPIPVALPEHNPGSSVHAGPVWSPSGNSIAAVGSAQSSADPNLTRIQVMTANGTGQVPGPAGYAVQWQP